MHIVALLLLHNADTNEKFLSSLERLKGIESLFTHGYYPDFKHETRFLTDGYRPLDFGAESVDAKSNYNRTPLGTAAQLKHKKVFENLLKAGADPNLQTNALPERGNCKSDNDINNGSQDFPLHSAIERGEKNIVIKLIKYGACINCAYEKGPTPLCHSVEKSGVGILIKL